MKLAQLVLIGLMSLLSVAVQAQWSMATYLGHVYAGEHGRHDGAAKFGIGMLCRHGDRVPAYVLVHRRFVTAGGPATELPARFEAGEVFREFRIDGVHYGDVGPRHGVHDADNHMLIFASTVSLDSPIIRAIRKGSELDVLYVDKEGRELYVSDFSLEGSAAALNQVACPD
ncbi:hypothetical protein [Alcanivorax sp. DP30]|uniref:hypothetical protein n=1 Tax=Alcanivorax sp. DP30 TaxID=2606217 RepID=UPI001370D560|nr:hypothetical protein [Alcanivorax sp. DP30]MZR64426.1 hypothetical protein [Alcanivorax sp. DP30]